MYDERRNDGHNRGRLKDGRSVVAVSFAVTRLPRDRARPLYHVPGNIRR